MMIQWIKMFASILNSKKVGRKRPFVEQTIKKTHFYVLCFTLMTKSPNLVRHRRRRSPTHRRRRDTGQMNATTAAAAYDNTAFNGGGHEMEERTTTVVDSKTAADRMGYDMYNGRATTENR